MNLFRKTALIAGLLMTIAGLSWGMETARSFRWNDKFDRPNYLTQYFALRNNPKKIAVSNDGFKKAIISEDGHALVMDNNGELLFELYSPRKIRDIGFTEDDLAIFTVLEDGTGQIWDAKTGNLNFNIDDNGYLISTEKLITRIRSKLSRLYSYIWSNE